MGYTRSVISGFGWHTALKIGTAGVTVLKLFVLARLLTPQDFGVFSLIAIALGLTEAATETGINITILQSPHSIHYYLNTAWVIALLRGLVIGSVMVVLGTLMGSYYHEPSLPLLIGLAALIPVIKGAINPSIVLMQKNLTFFKDSTYRFSLVLVEAILAAVLALTLHSVVGLILAMIGGAVFEVLISFAFFPDKPRFALIPSRAKEIMRNAQGLTISAALSYLYQNADDAIIGKTLGTYSLGLYHNAYALGHKTSYEFAQSAHHGTLPVLTKIVTDAPRLKRAFWKAFLSSMALVTGLSLPLLIAPRWIVMWLLGEQWLDIVSVAPIMVLAGILASGALLCYSLFVATKAYAYMNWHLGASVALMILFLAWFSPIWGLPGAAWALVLSRVLPLPILVFGVRRTLYHVR